VATALREARRGEELVVAELHVRSWQEAYRELMPAEFLAGLDPRERAERYRFGAGEAGGPTTVVAVEVDEWGRAGGVGGDPSLTNREVRSGSPPTPFEPMIGFVTYGPSRDEDARGLAEIYALYVDPERYRAGVGRLLMAEARLRLGDAGYTEAILWVLQGNTRAAEFYQGEGWRRDGASREENPYGIRSKVDRFRRGLRPDVAGSSRPSGH
jgi:ribosomal protein S18 acetylase RimI-like enzyme